MLAALTHFDHSGALCELLPFSNFIDDSGVFVLKNGHVGAVVSVTGRDPECLTDDEVLGIARTFESALRLFDERFRIYQYQLKRKMIEGFYHIETRFVFLFEQTKRGFLASGKQMRDDIGKRADTLVHYVEAFCQEASSAATVSICDQEWAFWWLKALVNYDEKRLNSIRQNGADDLDYQVCGSEIVGTRGAVIVGDTHARVLTLKTAQPERALPENTFPNYMAAMLDVQAESLVVTEFKPMSQFDARKMLEANAEHQHRSRWSSSITSGIVSLLSGLIRNDAGTTEKPREDALAVAAGEEIDVAIKDAGLNGMMFGHFGMTIIPMAPDARLADDAAARFVTAAAQRGVTLYVEQSAAQLVWFATMPGNSAYQVRTMKVSGQVYGDLSLFYQPDGGSPWNDHLEAENLAELDTRQGTRYSLNLHVGDVGHTFMLGMTGSGKTHASKHMLWEAFRRYNPRIVTFDMKDSYRQLIQDIGGSYMHVGEYGHARINPFSLEPTPLNLQFVASFVRVLLEASGYKLTDADERAVWEQVKVVYGLPENLRRLRNILLPRQIQEKLTRWTGDGQYGWLFDNDTDTVSFSRWQGFGFGDLDHEAIEPVLFYILHRASTLLGSGRDFSLFLIDEAWLFFRNETVRKYIMSALKTWREKNAAMILATQSGADLERSEIFDVIVESVATKILLPSPGADRDWLMRKLGLNEREAEHVLTMRPKKEWLVVQDGKSKVVQLNQKGETN